MKCQVQVSLLSNFLTVCLWFCYGRDKSITESTFHSLGNQKYDLTDVLFAVNLLLYEDTVFEILKDIYGDMLKLLFDVLIGNRILESS